MQVSRAYSFAFVLAFALVGCDEENSVIPDASRGAWSLSQYGCDRPVSNPRSVSIAALVATPERFEGKPVRVVGFFHSSFEHTAVYLHRDDAEHGIYPNGLWVMGDMRSVPSDKYVVIEGIFTARSHGHAGHWPATLCNAAQAAYWVSGAPTDDGPGGRR